MNTNIAGSATGIDLAPTPYGYAAEARDGHVTFFKERPTGFDQPKWIGLVRVVELYDRASATPQHSVTEQDEPIKTWQERVDPGYLARWKECGHNPAEAAMLAEIAERRVAARAQPLASTAATQQHSVTEREAFDAAFLSWNGMHTQSELDGEWARGTLAGEMFRSGYRAARAQPLASTAASEQQAGADDLPPMPEPSEVWGRGYNTRDMTIYARAALTHRATTATPGYQLVPIEPTPKMLAAAFRIDLSYMPGQESADREAIYKAMLAAAPDDATTAADQQGVERNAYTSNSLDGQKSSDLNIKQGDTPLDQYAPGQWWLASLEALWGHGQVDLDTRRAAKVACNFAAAVFAQQGAAQAGDQA